MSLKKQSMVVVPCSGIGKSLGTVTREAAYELCDNLRPSDTRLVALSKLVLGDAEACDAQPVAAKRNRSAKPLHHARTAG
jgi:hypothetical protein